MSHHAFLCCPGVKYRRSRAQVFFVLFCALVMCGSGCSKRTYDLVISSGHVMDPETGFDKVAHVGIVGDKIEAISEQPLPGAKTIDANGLVVAPGFIEIHSHGIDSLNYQYRAMDGVTMMLETESGALDVDNWYAERKGKTIVHYGVSVGHGPVRVTCQLSPTASCRPALRLGVPYGHR